ncbi:MAG: nuclear transport factor 2 family protein [Bacteroidota bacterium]
MKKILIVLSLTFLSISYLKAQDEILVRDCINNYLDGITKGDTSMLNRAFHYQAMLRTINASTGKMLEFPVKTFVSRTPQGGIQAKTKIISYSLIGQAAFASIELAFADFKYVDYLSLLKFGNDWKIVCRVFSKADLNAVATNVGGGAALSTTAKKGVKAKPKSDDGW